MICFSRGEIGRMIANYDITNFVLEKIRPYIDIEQISVLKNTEDKIDIVKLNEKYQVGFEVHMGSETADYDLTVLYFSEHQHFQSFDISENEDTIEQAIELLINLFTLPIQHIEKYQGTKLLNEKYSFIKNGKEECFSNSSIFHLSYNPFAKKSYKTNTLKYDATLKTFLINSPPKNIGVGD